MADETMTIKILRYDPSVDQAPEYKSYEVPWEQDMTALMALHYIFENVEPIGYDYCCRSGLCGRCSCLIDGVPGLACMRMLTQGEHTFDPLPGFPVVRDLVIDHSQVMKKMVDTHLAIQTVEPITSLCNIDHDLYWNKMEQITMCRECMSCYAVCEALQDNHKWGSFVGPAAMAQIALRFYDPQENGDRVAQAAAAGIFDCTLCGRCSTVCAASIDHVTNFKALQDAAEARGLKPTSAA